MYFQSSINRNVSKLFVKLLNVVIFCKDKGPQKPYLSFSLIFRRDVIQFFFAMIVYFLLI